MFCKYCGKEVKPTEIRCPGCGKMREPLQDVTELSQLFSKSIVKSVDDNLASNNKDSNRGMEKEYMKTEYVNKDDGKDREILKIMKKIMRKQQMQKALSIFIIIFLFVIFLSVLVSTYNLNNKINDLKAFVEQYEAENTSQSNWEMYDNQEDIDNSNSDMDDSSGDISGNVLNNSADTGSITNSNIDDDNTPTTYPQQSEEDGRVHLQTSPEF